MDFDDHDGLQEPPPLPKKPTLSNNNSNFLPLPVFPKPVQQPTPSPFSSIFSPKTRPIDKFCKKIADPKSSTGDLEKLLAAAPIDLNDTDDTGGCPMLYAIALQKIEVIDWLLAHGVDINKPIRDNKVPLQLAIEKGNIDMVRFFLVKLANPKLVDESVLKDAPLCIQYFVERAIQSNLLKPDERKQAILAKLKLEKLPSIELGLIGQKYAATCLNRMIPSFRLKKESSSTSKKPLVLVFAGPPGHGKTEMAKELGMKLCPDAQKSYVKLQMETIRDIWQIFGAPSGFSGTDKGSPLSNMLSNNNSNDAIVVMDEFEKTYPDVQQGLLNLFESGECRDGRGGKMYDCSRVIFILTTNAFDDTILKFTRNNPEVLELETKSDKFLEMLQVLQNDLQKQVKQRFGDPLARRVDEVIPFLPFSKHEQKVLADYVLYRRKLLFSKKLTDDDLSCEEINLNIHPTVHAHIAKDYDDAAGASSLERSVDKQLDQEIHRYFVEGFVHRHDKLYIYDDGKKVVVSKKPKPEKVESKSFSEKQSLTDVNNYPQEDDQEDPSYDPRKSLQFDD